MKANCEYQKFDMLFENCDDSRRILSEIFTDTTPNSPFSQSLDFLECEQINEEIYLLDDQVLNEGQEEVIIDSSIESMSPIPESHFQSILPEFAVNEDECNNIDGKYKQHI